MDPECFCDPARLSYNLFTTPIGTAEPINRHAPLKKSHYDVKAIIWS